VWGVWSYSAFGRLMEWSWGGWVRGGGQVFYFVFVFEDGGRYDTHTHTERQSGEGI